MAIDPQDPLLEPYRDLRGRRESLSAEGRPAFICEGRYLVEMALEEAGSGRLEVHSLLCTRSMEPHLAPRLPAGIPFRVLADADFESLAGFPFHRGVLLCAYRPAPRGEEEILAADRLLVLPRLDDAENTGLLLRSAAALGMDAVLTGPGPDIFQRRTARVSMGAVFRIPVLRVEDPMPLLLRWKTSPGEIAAACLGPEALDVGDWAPPRRCALLLGPEDRGLAPEWLLVADRRVRIPMSRGMDSLNVAAAGAILMHRLASFPGPSPSQAV
jgi:tRNA G18 (ribose-2'-O)-methylase SpoU